MNEFKIAYAIVEAQTIPELRLKVDRHLLEGWEPIGGFVVIPQTSIEGSISVMYKHNFAQTMIKRAQHD